MFAATDRDAGLTCRLCVRPDRAGPTRRTDAPDWGATLRFVVMTATVPTGSKRLAWRTF